MRLLLLVLTVALSSIRQVSGDFNCPDTEINRCNASSSCTYCDTSYDECSDVCSEEYEVDLDQNRAYVPHWEMSEDAGMRARQSTVLATILAVQMIRPQSLANDGPV